MVLALHCNVLSNVTKTVCFIRFVQRVLTHFSCDSVDGLASVPTDGLSRWQSFFFSWFSEWKKWKFFLRKSSPIAYFEGGGGLQCPTLSCRFWANFSYSVSAGASQWTSLTGKSNKDPFNVQCFARLTGCQNFASKKISVVYK